jgi:ABC-type transport system involved in cytochrome c biogenesis permease subunit
MRENGRESLDIANGFRWVGLLAPATIAISMALALTLLRVKFSLLAGVSDATFLLIALAAYITGAMMLLTELKIPSRIFRQIGTATVTFGVFASLSSWLFRWILAYERELEIFITEGRDMATMPWILRYIPFANLYDMSIAFAFGAGVASLVLLGNPRNRIVSAFTLPLAALVMTLARFIGDEFVDLPPVLDSVWRPIHVGTAAISYGTALVCFAVAILFLLKDGANKRWLIFWTGLFGSLVLLLAGDLHLLRDPLTGTYPIGLLDASSGTVFRLRVDLDNIGWLHLAALLATIGATATSGWEIFRTPRHPLNSSGILCGVSTLLTFILALSIASSVGIPLGEKGSVSDRRLMEHGKLLAETTDILRKDGATISDTQVLDTARIWLDERKDVLEPSLRANPVENTSLVTVILLGLFAFLVNVRHEAFLRILPPAKDLDELTYKLAAFTFVGLGVLLATGAVWANESWGRYWGWDAKEVGALCAWLTYAVFLHARITRGWQGRRSAYFAILAFLFVIFTYLGVSYLLPGLHSYA